jgi:hypothetical protein
MLNAQEESSISDQEKTAFVVVYQEFKTEKPDANALAESVYRKNNIEADEVKAYRKNPKKSDANQKLRRIYYSTQSFYDRTSATILNRLCDKHGITKERYDLVLHKYKTDISFQYILRPYFQAYFKNN